MKDEWAATTVKPKDQEYTDKGLSKHLNKIASKGYRVTKTWHNTFSNHIFKIYYIEQLIGTTKMAFGSPNSEFGRRSYTFRKIIS
jgi:hypothetical protein